MDGYQLALPFALAAATAAAATPLVRRAALARGIVDQPSPRNVSQRAGMPLLGGLAVALGFVAGLALALLLGGEIATRGHLGGLALGAGIMLGVGIVDDRRGLGAWPKVLAGAVAAAIAIGSGFNIAHVTDPISRTSFMLPDWLSWVVTLAWILGITNAINLIDGLDGLAAGVGAIIGTTLTVICWQAGMYLGVFVGLALVGSLLGFLPFNFAPARIFLGDTGALFIGYVLSLLALEGYRQMTLLTFVVPLLALAVPILDTLLSILRRLRLGAPVFSADRQHMHHRLLASAGGSHRSAALQFYWVTAAFCLLAVSFTRLRGVVAAACLVAVALLTLRLLRNLGVLSLEREGGPGGLPAGGRRETS
jgi:UDP-GlcNAc:undecaprenyl-phosphate GlcNAc-1-phosphate transferase